MRFGDFLVLAERLPAEVLRPDRRRCEYLSSVLARNELGSNYPYNRWLFLRVRYGRYVLNFALALVFGESWVLVYDAMGVSHMVALGLRRYAEAVDLIDGEYAPGPPWPRRVRRTGHRAAAPADASRSTDVGHRCSSSQHRTQAVQP
jgi:hypothetical protein